ncbi:WD repeat-containing protein 83 [Phlyctochytrium planicorne]|nr:WD repeat-containing protein 83 [Phlyctochytrium planicorne]
MASVNVAHYSNDGLYVMTGSGDKCIKLWNPKSGLCIKTYSGHGWEVVDIDLFWREGSAVSPLTLTRRAKDNSRFVSVGGDRAVFVWDVGTGAIIRRFIGHGARVNAVAFNLDNTVAVSGSYDATVRFWDLRSQNVAPIQILTDAKDSISSVKVSGHQILTGCIDGIVRTYDIRFGRMEADDIKSPVTHTCFSNDQNCVLASSLDNTVRLLDKDNGDVLAEYRGHKNSEYKIASTLSNDDAYVISGSEDGRICFWDLVEGTLIKTLHPHTSLVTSVNYHPSKDFMVSTSKDGTAKVFSAQ